MSRFGEFTINEVTYDLDDLTLDEVENVEDLCGGLPFSELNFGSAKVMKAIAFTLMRRSNSELEMAEVGKVRVIDFLPADEEMPALPPDQGVTSDSENPSESGHADSGVRPSLVSTSG